MINSSAVLALNEDDIHQYEEIDLGLRVRLAKHYAKHKQILNWGKVVFPHKFPLPFSPTLHPYLVSIRHEDLTNTEAPRFHSKTTTKCFLVPTFQALEEPDTFNFYLNVQATDKKALAINTAIREEMENNEVIREIYGDLMDTKKWTDQQFILKNDVLFTAVSASQSIRGIQFENRRPDYVIVDDLYNEDDIHNLDSTEKKTAWLWGTLYPAMAVGRRTSFHLQGTAINTVDALEKAKKQKTIKSRSFKAIVDENNKEVLWPEGKSFDALVAMRNLMGTIIFNREMQNERSDDKESKVKRVWLTNWEFDPNYLLKEIQLGKNLKLTAVIIGNDPSIGKNTEADDTGTALVFKTTVTDGSRNDYWIYGLWAEKISLEERKDQLERISKSLPVGIELNEVKIEAIAAFDDYASYVEKKTNLPVKRISFVKDKLSTLENKSHHFENGRVHLNQNIGYTSDGRNLKEMIIEQLTTNYPKHDDVRDGVLLTLDDDSGLWSFV